MKAKLNKYLKKILILLFIIIPVIVVAVVYSNWKIPHDTESLVFDNIDDIPAQKVALVLGTAPNIGSRPNLYFSYRIKAAIELYNAGKTECFVVSGDNRKKSYNEPEYMREALIEGGIPDSVIYLDYAGFRTLDSVVRMNKIFGQDSFIVVSQKFHNERAIFLAQHYDCVAYGYNAKDLSVNKLSIKTKVRELFARVKVFVDIFIGKDPKYLGEPIEIK